MAGRKTTALPDLSQYGQLAEYNRKRHFDVHAGAVGARRPSRGPGGRCEFVVQKHRASAAPLRLPPRAPRRDAVVGRAEGPVARSAVKRLAMETEPHPMDYASSRA